MSVGIVLDDHYNFLLMKMLRDASLEKKSKSPVHDYSLTDKKKLLGNLIIFDKFFVNTDYLDRAYNGVEPYDQDITWEDCRHLPGESLWLSNEEILKMNAEMDRRRVISEQKRIHWDPSDLDGEVAEDNATLNNLLENNVLETWVPYNNYDPHNLIPWIPYNHIPNPKQVSKELTTLNTYYSLFGSYFKKRGFFKKESDMQCVIQHFEDYAYFDSAGYGGVASVNTRLYPYCQSIRTSIRKKAPLLTNITNVTSEVKKYQETADDVYQLVGIVMNEITHYPQPKNLDEALTIRENPMMLNFRHSLLNWTESLVSGDIKDELATRKDLHNLCNKFKTANWCSRIGRFATYISLPVSVIDLAIAGSFAGLSLTAIGYGAQVAADTQKARIYNQIFGM